MHTKRLVLRLSSLGDLILASSVLEVSALTENAQLDWVVASEFRDLLVDHPKINHLYLFDRASGLKGWVRFCREIWDQRYQEIFDLHRSLRTSVMKVLFFYWGCFERGSLPVWKRISKQRVRTYLYYLLKKSCPPSWRPVAWVKRFTKRVGGTGNERPNLRHLLSGSVPERFSKFSNLSQKYICVMPSSRWSGKNWPVDFYVQLLKKIPYLPLVMGRPSDQGSVELIEKLMQAKVPFESAVGTFSLQEVSHLLKGARAYVGSDTGLAHLAESLGTPAQVLYGPTTTEMGFGPWMKGSQEIGSSLWCRPCGKDGRSCFRISQRHLCLKGLSVDTVFGKLRHSLNDSFDHYSKRMEWTESLDQQKGK